MQGPTDGAQRDGGGEGDGRAEFAADGGDSDARDPTAAESGDASEGEADGDAPRDPNAGSPAPDAAVEDPDAGGTRADAGDGETDAGGSHAGAGGSGGAGAGGNAAPEATCAEPRAGELLCEDFEASELSGWSRYSEGPDGRTVRTTQHAHTGSGALDSIKVDPGSSDPIYQDVLGQRTSGHLYLRAYLRVPSSFAITPAGSRASLLVLGEDAGTLGGLSLVLWDGALSLQINGQVVSDVKAAYALPRDQWLCVQIDFEIGAVGSARLRVGGQVVAEGVRNTLMPTHYERLWLGVNWVAPEQTDDVRVFYDDVLVGTSEAPCD